MSVYDSVRHRLGVLFTELKGAERSTVEASMHYMDDLERQVKDSESRAEDLSTKLDQAIDLLDTNARSYLLAEWSNP